MTVKALYTDIDDSITINSDGTIKIVENEDSITQSIVTILSTAKGERVMLPQFGSELRGMLFSQLDDTTARLIESEISTAIGKWENRISIQNVEVVPDYDNNRYVIIIDYVIILLGKSQQMVTGLRVKV